MAGNPGKPFAMSGHPIIGDNRHASFLPFAGFNAEDAVMSVSSDGGLDNPLQLSDSFEAVRAIRHQDVFPTVLHRVSVPRTTGRTYGRHAVTLAAFALRLRSMGAQMERHSRTGRMRP
jgi:hypothetical protein